MKPRPGLALLDFMSETRPPLPKALGDLTQRRQRREAYGHGKDQGYHPDRDYGGSAAFASLSVWYIGTTTEEYPGKESTLLRIAITASQTTPPRPPRRSPCGRRSCRPPDA